MKNRSAPKPAPVRPDAPSLAARVGRGLLIVHLALSPLTFSRSTLEGFEFNKASWLLLAAIALLGLGLSHLPHLWVATPSGERLPRLKESARRLLRDPIALGVLLFLLSAVVSTACSVGPRTSLFGCHESFAGLLTVAAYAVLFFATRTLCRTPADVRNLFGAAAVGASVAAAHGLTQAAGGDPSAWEDLSVLGGWVRPFAGLGHPNLLGAYLAVASPLGAWLALRAWRLRRFGACAAFVLLGVMGAVAVVLTLSRAAWLALAVAVLMGGAGWAVAFGSRRVAIRPALAGLVLMAGLVGVLFAAAGGKGLPAALAERLRNLGDASGRIEIWSAAWGIFRDHPLTGSGLDTFQLAFGRHRTVRYWEIEWGATPSKAHNDLLHVLATQGLLGGVALLVLGFGLVSGLGRAWQTQKADRWLVLALAAALAAFVVQGLFGFTATACGALFVTLAGVLSRLASKPADLPTAEEAAGFAWPAWAVAGLLAAAVFLHNFGEFSPARVALLGSVMPAAFALAVAALARTSRGIAPAVPAPGSRTRPPALVLQLGVWAGCAALAHFAVVVPWRADRCCALAEPLLRTDPRQALQRLEAAVALDPKRDVLRVKLGAAAEALARDLPPGPERRRLLGLGARALGAARRLAPAATFHAGNVGGALAELAREGLARPADAFDAFDAALAGDPNNAFLYVDASRAALRLGDVARAGRYLAAGLARYPRFGALIARRGELHLLEGRVAEALGDLAESVRASEWHGDWEGWATAAFVRGAVLLRLGRAEDALDAVAVVFYHGRETDAHRSVRARALEALKKRMKDEG